MNSTAQSVVATFLRAFSRLDLDAMLDCFAHEATAFLPAEHQRTRLEGQASIRDALADVIARVRATGATSIPLDADDVILEEWGDTAVATFPLHGAPVS